MSYIPQLVRLPCLSCVRPPLSGTRLDDMGFVPCNYHDRRAWMEGKGLPSRHSCMHTHARTQDARHYTLYTATTLFTASYTFYSANSTQFTLTSSHKSKVKQTKSMINVHKPFTTTRRATSYHFILKTACIPSTMAQTNS